MSQHEILPGLPPYGPEALPFSATGMGTHREGFVVRFVPYSKSSWVGNFQPGLTEMYCVVPHPDNLRTIVVAGGQAYVIAPQEPAKWTHFGGSISFAQPIPELDAILFGNGLWFELLGPESMIWKTRRISWDGMRDLALKGLTLTGRSWCYDDTWSDFAVDLVEGTVTDGSYDGPGSPQYAT
jgi:hypothetical protein